MFSKSHGFVVPAFSDNFIIKGVDETHISIRYKHFGEYETADVEIAEFGASLSLMSKFDFSDLLALMNELIELDNDVSTLMNSDHYDYQIVSDVAYKAERRGETNMRIIEMREQIIGFDYRIFDVACMIYCALYNEDYKYFS